MTRRPGGPEDATPSIESLSGLRLRALLNDLLRDLGPVKAAAELGIDRKTLWRSQGAGQMSPRLVDALEGLVLRRVAAALEEDRQRVRALEGRVGELERQLTAALAVVNGLGSGGDAVAVEESDTSADALRREFARELQRLERRLDRQRPAPNLANDPRDGAGASRADSPRRHQDLVTREPADDDAQVYGAAWPLVDEWRQLRAGHLPRGKGLAWTARRQRILELEVAMLDEHGLTLPPETAPLGGLDRREQWSWRERELARVRKLRARLELLGWARRTLTLGRWRWR